MSLALKLKHHFKSHALFEMDSEYLVFSALVLILCIFINEYEDALNNIYNLYLFSAYQGCN